LPERGTELIATLTNLQRDGGHIVGSLWSVGQLGLVWWSATGGLWAGLMDKIKFKHA
jgi:hypothetical protein